MRLGVVGATGAVGVEVLRSLEHRRVEVAELRLFASPSSVGTLLAFRGEQIAVQALVEDGSCFDGLSVVIFAASKAVAQQFAPLAAKRGAVAVDNSSFFRLDPEVPLVVPEINGADIFLHKGIISNPNCTTAICLMALHPLHLRFKLVRVFASSYQAVSGTGQKAIVELSKLCFFFFFFFLFFPHSI
jgi:aspartate-semialdehyde dehydrogenase